MNKVIQTLRLVADPETKTYGDGKTLVSFRGAVNKRFVKDGEPNADFFNYTAFGKTAEFIAKYFKKGDPMLITGEINNNNYEKDGVKHYSCQILVDNVEFFSKKSDSDNSGSTSKGSYGSDNGSKKESSKPVTQSYDEYDDF